MVIKTNPEFGIELVLTIPYAYYLHTQGKLEQVITSKGMKPFYYFCDNVIDELEYRSIDNEHAGLNSLPNNWIHHNAEKVFGTEYSNLSKDDQAKANGYLDYSEWKCPPYRDHFKDDSLKLDKPTIFVSNKYNIEHGEMPHGYYDIMCLYEIFTYLTEKGYSVIYKRATNKEGFTIDQNEWQTLNSNLNKGIIADVDGIGPITDHLLTKYFKDVYLVDDLIGDNDYNETQLKLMANSSGFISVCGGNSVLSSCFEAPVITYVHKGKELRPQYFDENSYFRKLSGADIYPVFDIITKINDIDKLKEWGYQDDQFNYSGTNDYTTLLNTIKTVFK